MKYPRSCEGCPAQAASVQIHIDAWEKAMMKALRRGDFCAAQFAANQLEKYQDMLCEIEKAAARASRR